ncbi:MAG: C39 family peptidase [Lachnospiraceae bacterium]|nr:C39 family peptidase [Lachnospiraceae bacterium]
MNKRKIITAILFFLSVFLFYGKQVRAAFPTDMEKRPVIASCRKGGEVSVYKDAALTKKIMVADGKNLTVKATRVEGNSIFGSYESGNTKGEGWFPISDFVEDPEYENVYATVRETMPIYEDADCSSVQTKIKKYRGIIVVSKEGSSRQVICESKNHYEIGWMDGKDFVNTLEYDGREKQTLADGIYEFGYGYQDDESGGSEDQQFMNQFKKWQFSIRHISADRYYLQNVEDGRYLTVSCKKSGKRCSYSLDWTAQPDEEYGQFKLKRQIGAYLICNTKSNCYLAQNLENDLVLYENRNLIQSVWRVRAIQKMSNPRNPFVFTQYDPLWCKTPYGGGGCMGTAGCGILATVNAVYALSGQYMDVMELADYAVEKNYRIVGSGTDDGIFKAACKEFGKKYGFAWDGKSGSVDVLKKKLKAGDTAVAHVEGHYVCISDYDKKTKKYLVLDSNYIPKRETSAFGDWVKVKRLLSGPLEAKNFFFFKLR